MLNSKITITVEYLVFCFGRVQCGSPSVCIGRRRCSSSWCSWLWRVRESHAEETVHTGGLATCPSKRSTIATLVGRRDAVPAATDEPCQRLQLMMMMIGEITMWVMSVGRRRHSHSRRTCCHRRLLLRSYIHTLCPDKTGHLDIVNNCVKLMPALTKLNAQYFFKQFLKKYASFCPKLCNTSEELLCCLYV